MFSKACEYGIKAVIQISQTSGEGDRISLKELAKKIDSPEAFTAKIMQMLTKKNIVSSFKGPNGGFHMSEDKITTTKLCHIVKAIDGDKLFTECGLGLKKCDENKPCPVHDQFKGIRSSIIGMLESTTMRMMIDKVNRGESYLKI